MTHTTLRAAAIVVALAHARAANAQEVTGLLSAGRTIALPGAEVPSLTPVALADFRLTSDPIAPLRTAWSLGATSDDLERLGTRLSVRAPAGPFVVHATFERAAVRQLDEIQDFSRTGRSIPAHDGRLEVGALGRYRALWAGASARYAESLLADRTHGVGELVLDAGWRHKGGAEVAVEGRALAMVNPSATASEREPYARLAAVTPAITGLRVAAGASWDGTSDQPMRPVGAGASIRWSGWRDHVRLAGGAEWATHERRDVATECTVSGKRLSVGTRLSRESSGTTRVELWVGSR